MDSRSFEPDASLCGDASGTRHRLGSDNCFMSVCSSRFLSEMIGWPVCFYSSVCREMVSMRQYGLLIDIWLSVRIVSLRKENLQLS